MPRCPDFLDPDDFDRLAGSVGVSLTDFGVSALGEAIEMIATQVILVARDRQSSRSLDIDDILRSLRTLGVEVELSDNPTKTLKLARLGAAAQCIC